jgi:hypothetical protein
MTEWEKELTRRADAATQRVAKIDPTTDPMLETKTRFAFFSELQTKYVAAHDRVLKSYNSYKTQADYLQLARIEAFLKILKDEMASQSHMDIQEWGVRDLIESLPKPKVSSEEKEKWRQIGAGKRDHSEADSEGGQDALGEPEPTGT